LAAACFAAFLATADASHAKELTKADPACLSGELIPAADLEAQAEAGAEAAMRTYLALAGVAKGADASSAFIPKSRLRGRERVDGKQMIGEVDDPLARAIAAGEAELEPVVVIRSGQGETAIGQWKVRTFGGTPRGHYWVWFRPENGIWKITRLEILFEPSRPTQTMSRYCLMPGDMDIYRQKIARREARRIRRELELTVRPRR
jgi:hypothetical protein